MTSITNWTTVKNKFGVVHSGYRQGRRTASFIIATNDNDQLDLIFQRRHSDKKGVARKLYRSKVDSACTLEAAKMEANRLAELLSDAELADRFEGPATEKLI